MIAQLQQSLIQRNTNYEKKKKNLDDVLAERSLKDRLASLSNSAEQWKSRPTRETPPPLQRRTSANILQDLPIFQRNQRQSLPVTVTEKPCDITSGLKKFFNNNNNPTSSSKIDEGIEIDLDVISAKATPVLKTVTRPRAPNRKRAVKSENLHDDRLDLSQVKLDDHKFSSPIDEEEPEKLETQEQAIAALKDAKCLLKTPTKVSPYPQVMLIQIRGSKHVDVRLVAPAMTSLHEFACFLVVSPENLLKYEGSASNILEKTKAAQLAIQIMGKADLNCHASSLTTVTHSTGRSQLSKLLYSSENSQNQSVGSNLAPLNSDPFETQISKLNLVLRIADNDRTAHVCSRRERLSYSILQPSEVLIFDFGSEIYVWSGRYSSKVSTAYAVEYAKQLMGKAVGRSHLLGESEDSGRDGRRPEWTLFRRIHQGVLDTLFQSKFSDWPETRELVTTCKPKPLFSTSKKNPDVKTYEDVKISNEDDDVMRLVERMLSEPEFDPILILEDQEIDRNLRDVISESRDLWILRGETLENIDFSEHFDSQRCYVFRWKYRIQKSGVRRLKTGETTDRETGRSRIAFFYWLGEHTTPKQHGLCALRIKEIDRDNSPRVRVADGNEPALFLALFDGKFRVSKGATEPGTPRRYVAIGANLRETSLREIDDLDAPLRSHSAYIDLLAATTATQTAPHIICGANCTPEQVHFVLAHASHLQESGSHAHKGQVEVEGDRKSRRWIQSNGRKRAPRVWRIFENEAEPVHHLSAHSECAFTFSQQILSETILIDVGEALWLWSEDIVTTFSLKLVEKYWKSRQGPTRVVYKGAEPEQFKALFMKWTDSDEVENPMECRDAKELLKERCRTFSLNELKERTNLPAGMDMRRLESYLTDDDFQKAFGIGRDEFYAQKAWKQNEARKRAGLF